MYELSVVIPSKNEEFIGLTIKSLLDNTSDKTEIIAVLDGWDVPIVDIPESPRVKIINLKESIGQRAATNLAVRQSKAKYICKVDAHCAFDEDFDTKMLDAFKEVGDNVTMLPMMLNLHGFDWVCPEGHRRYQSPSGPCKECGKPTTKDIIFKPRSDTPHSTSYRFDKSLHFQYWNEYKKKQVGDLVETMSAQGSCFMMTREKYWSLNICDEAFGSWGQQGTEIACKTWLSGGRLLVNKKTWYAHLFRTQGGDFSFPYPQHESKIAYARKFSRDLFLNNKYPQAIHEFQWLIDKFSPPDWENTELPSRGILFYTNNKLNMKIAKIVRNLIKVNSGDLPVTSVSLKPLDFGNNIVFKGESGYKTMYQQILLGLEAMKEEVVYFCEHDVLYHQDHFNFIPPKKDVWYYNGNYWMLRPDGFAIHYDVSPLSGLVVYRDVAIKHFKERLIMIEKQGFGYYMGFEPFTHGRIKWDFWCEHEIFMPANPNVDLTTGGNMTQKRWTQDRFRKKPKFWEESNDYKIPGWNDLNTLYREVI